MANHIKWSTNACGGYLQCYFKRGKRYSVRTVKVNIYQGSGTRITPENYKRSNQNEKEANDNFIDVDDRDDIGRL
jgi:hypothetical protein